MVVRGRYKEIDGGDTKQGDSSTTKVPFSPTYYKLTINGEELIEVDTINMIERVNGVDLLAAHRTAIGL